MQIKEDFRVSGSNQKDGFPRVSLKKKRNKLIEWGILTLFFIIALIVIAHSEDLNYLEGVIFIILFISSMYVYIALLFCSLTAYIAIKSYIKNFDKEKVIVKSIGINKIKKWVWVALSASIVGLSLYWIDESILDLEFLLLSIFPVILIMILDCLGQLKNQFVVHRK